MSDHKTRDMVETVATVLAEMDGRKLDDFTGAALTRSPVQPVTWRGQYEERARAVIAAMRELPAVVRDAGVEAFDRDSDHMSTFHCLGVAWRAMITKALE